MASFRRGGLQAQSAFLWPAGVVAEDDGGLVHRLGHDAHDLAPLPEVLPQPGALLGVAPGAALGIAGVDYSESTNQRH